MSALSPAHVLLCGFLSTAVLTFLLRGSVELHFSRMDLPFILGTAFSADRERAKAIGALVHFLNGLAFSYLYAAFFAYVRPASPLLGALLGLAHGLFVLIIALPLLPSFHPRMATTTRGPDPTPMLEPPGFMALNYGPRTPEISLLAHVIYGALLGALL